jgi:peptide deformylase
LEEGCLSIPDQTADVERPAEVEVRYLDEAGEMQSLVANGLLAACVQHEIDHLNGVLFVDHISRLKRDMILRRVMKEMRQTTSRN